MASSGGAAEPGTLGERDAGEPLEPLKHLVPRDFARFGNIIPPSAFQNRHDIASVVLPECVLEIGDEAFKWCKNLLSVEISSRVKVVGKLAFYGCGNLVSVNLPDSVREISRRAFANCSKLQVCSFSQSLKVALKSFDSSAFEGCHLLAPSVKEGWEVHLKPEDFGHFGRIIPRNTFLGRTDITSVVFSTTAAMAENTFKGCTGLKAVTFSSAFRSIGPGVSGDSPASFA